MNRRVIALALACLLVGLAAGAAVGVLVLDDNSDDSEQAGTLDPPDTTAVVRLMAPDDGCWKRTIGDEVRHGCGSLTFPLPGNVSAVFERTPPASWTWCAVVEADGRIVQTFGPGSNREYPMVVGWTPREPGQIPLQIDPVTC